MCAPLHTHTHIFFFSIKDDRQNMLLATSEPAWEKSRFVKLSRASERRSDGYHFISGYIAKQEPLTANSAHLEWDAAVLTLSEGSYTFLFFFFPFPRLWKRRRALISSFFNKGAKRNVLIKSISEPFRKMTPNIWNNMWNVIPLHYDPFRRLTALFLL